MIVQRGDSWLVRVYTGRLNGKRQFVNRTVRGTEKDAENVETALKHDRNRGLGAAPAKLTLNAFLDRWLQDSHRARVREFTLGNSTRLLAKHVRPILGSKPLHKIRPLDVQGLYTKMETDSGLSPKTIRHVHVLIRQALEQAKAWDYLARNPTDGVKPPKVERAEMQALTLEQARALIAATAVRHGGRSEAGKDTALIRLALSTGMRPSEYLALRWSDIVDGVISVQRKLSRYGKRWKFEAPKTASSRRTIALDPAELRALDVHKRRQTEARLKAGPAWKDHGLVFPGDDGSPAVLNTLVYRFKTLAKAAGIASSVRLYDLRHSYASLALQAGVPVKVVQERMGHSNAAITLTVYGHVMPGMQEAAAAKMAALFGE